MQKILDGSIGDRGHAEKLYNTWTGSSQIKNILVVALELSIICIQWNFYKPAV
jgi:hypothetical protein